MKNPMKFCCQTISIAMFLVCSPALLAQTHPGRVDFNSLAGFDETNVTVDIELGGWLLNWAKAAAHGDDDLRLISQVESVRVKVFEVRKRRDYQSQADTVVKSLIGSGWERMARVNEDDSWVHILVKGNADQLEGITVIAMDEDAEAVLINISGRLNPDDVAALLDDEDLINVDLDLDWGA